MREAVLYTGTFDPFHRGHLWQLESTYEAHRFERVAIAMIQNNPKKPNATSWKDRKVLAEMMLRSKQLPFKFDILPINYVQPEMLKEFVTEHLSGYHVVRTVGDDVIVEFARDTDFGFTDALTIFHNLVVVRSLVGVAELNNAIDKLPDAIKNNFTFEVIHVRAEGVPSATDIRKDPEAAYYRKSITRDQLEFITRKQLYS